VNLITKLSQQLSSNSLFTYDLCEFIHLCEFTIVMVFEFQGNGSLGCNALTKVPSPT